MSSQHLSIPDCTLMPCDNHYYYLPQSSMFQSFNPRHNIIFWLFGNLAWPEEGIQRVLKPDSMLGSCTPSSSESTFWPSMLWVVWLLIDGKYAPGYATVIRIAAIEIMLQPQLAHIYKNVVSQTLTLRQRSWTQSHSSSTNFPTQQPSRECYCVLG